MFKIANGKIPAAAAATAVTAAALLAWPGSNTAAAPGSHDGRAPVVVELFTSEGCSDCPPAEALAARLKRTQPIPGAQIIVLAEHVDYFNSARWADRFSSPAYSARQQGYVDALHLDSQYTPQMVVDGHTQFVGSDEDQADRAIAQAARAPKADVQVSRAGDAVRVQVDHVPASDTDAACDVLLAVTEDGLRVHIGGGENAGRSLNHDAVVRSLRVIGALTTASPGFAATVPLAAGADPHASQAVVFVQRRADRRIIGAATLVL